MWFVDPVGSCFVKLTCAVRLISREGGVVRVCAWASVEVVLHLDLEAVSCDLS